MSKVAEDFIHFLRKREYIMINNALGSGSFSKTVLVKDPFIDELFVVKKYEPTFSDNYQRERFFKNFLDEIKILHKLSHRNIVRIYSFYPYEKQLTGFILMEHVDGVSIDDYIFSEYNALFPSVEEITLDDLFKQLIDGFQYIEDNGIIHRDIREGNIMIDKSGTVKIIDFGIGKVAEKGELGTDSLVNDINRDNSDTLPKEYYEGVYNSKTDMFYLGELIQRLIKSAENVDNSEFSYFYILEKMMSKAPEDRYASFSEIKDTIGKHDFGYMNITKEDKDIYQNYANHLHSILSAFLNEKKMSNDVEYFISQLERVLQTNCFEDYIQDNRDIVRCIVIGGYRYTRSPLISCENVRTFLEWFKSSSLQSQQLILNNIISKISAKEIEESEPELPF